MPRLASRLAIAVAVALLTAAVPAYGAWDQPQLVDQTSEGFDNSSAGDVAVGDNGLATIFFLQADDDGTKLWATRRSAGESGWLKPGWALTPRPSGGFSIEAAPDGSTAGAYRRQGPEPDIPLEDPTQDIFAIGWPDTAAGAPANEDVADNSQAQMPAVDTDGRGNGWIAFIEGKNLKIIRFDLADPEDNDIFTVQALTPGPDSQSGSETDSRSNPQIDVNADGDVIVSFVEARRIAEFEPELPRAPVNAIYAVRKLRGEDKFTPTHRISHNDEDEPVTEHDPAIVENGDATVLFAADPDRDDTDRAFGRRWLASGDKPRPEPGGIEFVSSSEPNAADVSRPRAEAGPGVRVTAAWLQGGSELNSAERTTTWTLPQALSSSSGAYDIAVDADGVATVAYHEGVGVRARRRAPDQKWDAAVNINTTPVDDSVDPKVDAGIKEQADAYFVQADGVRSGAFATRFTGGPPQEEEQPKLPDSEGCPGDIAVLVGDAGANSIAGGDERETILGGDGDDTLAGGGADDCIRGQGGDDAVHGEGGNDDVDGGDGDDRVTGGDGNDRLNGGIGTDSLSGSAGDDIATGGDGNDTVDGADGSDLLNGDAGDDLVRGGLGDDVATGADGNDRVVGNAGTNTLAGGLGDDRLFGGPQTDTLFGEDGNDRLNGGGGPDSLNGAAGNDALRGGNGEGMLDGGDGDDRIRGGRQADRLFGQAGLDTLFGKAGSDVLLGGPDKGKAYGGPGKDRLVGDAAVDVLRGGKGRDRLDGGEARDRVAAGGGNDRIVADDGKRDRINCGLGVDRVVADAKDRVRANCERVRRSA